MSAFGALEAARPPVGQHLTNNLTSQMGKPRLQEIRLAPMPMGPPPLLPKAGQCGVAIIFKKSN